jgi:hypothetical protein
MRPIDDPSCLTPEERFTEVASILAAGVLRLHAREAIVASLREQLKQGDKALVGNKGYRKYLHGEGPKFAIDEEKIKWEERFDGKWVLQTDLEEPEKVTPTKSGLCGKLWKRKGLLSSPPTFTPCPSSKGRGEQVVRFTHSTNLHRDHWSRLYKR